MPTVKAAVLETIGQPLRLQTLELEAPREHEVLVDVVATGICHTDAKIAQGERPVPLPVVLGHEGAGIVRAVGSAVHSVQPGDHVVMSFSWCGHCENCTSDHPSICDSVRELTFGCMRPEDGSSPLARGGATVHGYFFGQSSFAQAAITPERNLVQVPKDLPLERLGPLACGFQTGAGTVLNALQVAPGSSLAVFGTGSVGLAAVMAARIAGAARIVAIDINPARLELATELGATHAIDASELDSVVARIRAICGAPGVHYAMDTTNIPAVVQSAISSLRIGGTYAHVGGGGKQITVSTTELLFGRKLMGVVQGDSVPRRFIPELIRHYRDGRFPFDRLLTFYEFGQINEAIADMEAGRVVKPVLRVAASV